MTDDRRIGEDVERLVSERAERRQRETDDLAVVGGTKTHRAADDNGPMDFEPGQFFRVPSSRILRVFLGLMVLAALVGYGVSYSTGVAYGFGLQAIEASVGIGVGLLFLAREGLSFAMLRVMPTADKAEVQPEESAEDAARPAERAAAR